MLGCAVPVCLRVRVHALRIVSMDKILRFINPLLLQYYISLLPLGVCGGFFFFFFGGGGGWVGGCAVPACVRVRVHVLRIVSTDKILHFINTLLLYYIHLLPSFCLSDLSSFMSLCMSLE